MSSSTRLYRTRRLLAEMRAVLASVPAFAHDPAALSRAMLEFHLGAEEFLTLPEDRLEHPAMFGPFDGEAECEALLLCKVELTASEFEAAADYVLTLRPDYEPWIRTLRAAG